MQDSRPSLYAYITTSICVLIFYVLKWENLITVVKPVIVPAIYYYYVQTTKTKINIEFTIAVWLFFIADMIEIVDAAAGIYLIMACSLTSYIIMFRFAILDNIKLEFSWKSSLLSITVVVIIAILSGQIINQTHTEHTIFFYFFVLYTLIVLSMFGYAILRLISKNDASSKLFILMVATMLVSDFLFASNKYILYYMPRAILSFVAQFTSYYFMVEYFNKRGFAKSRIER